MGTNMALMWGGRWEDGKDGKSRQKRESQKAASEVSGIERKECKICKFSVSHSGVDQNSCLLGCKGYQGDVTSQKIVFDRCRAWLRQ